MNVFIEFMLEIINFTVENIIASKREKSVRKNLVNEEINDSVNDSVNKQIIKIIKANPFVSAVEIAKKINKSVATVNRRLSLLKKAEIIKRIGPDKNGYWKVVG